MNKLITDCSQRKPSSNLRIGFRACGGVDKALTILNDLNIKVGTIVRYVASSGSGEYTIFKFEKAQEGWCFRKSQPFEFNGSSFDGWQFMRMRKIDQGETARIKYGHSIFNSNWKDKVYTNGAFLVPKKGII